MSREDGLLDLFGESNGVELIQKTPLFSSLGYEDTLRVANAFRLERYSRGTRVVEQSALGQALYIVRSGTVQVRRCFEHSAPELIATLGAGEMFGEMSLIDEVLTSAEVVVSSEESELLVLPRDGFQSLLSANDKLALTVYKAFCRTLSERLRGMLTRVSAARA